MIFRSLGCRRSKWHFRSLRGSWTINVIDGWFEWTGPLACLSPFSVMLWIRSNYSLLLKHGILKKLVTLIEGLDVKVLFVKLLHLFTKNYPSDVKDVLDVKYFWRFSVLHTDTLLTIYQGVHITYFTFTVIL